MTSTPIYVKTPKGIEEINSRAYGLPSRARRLLILLDGKRSSREIAPMLPEGESESLLTTLVAGGFAVPLQQALGEEASPAKAVARIERPQNDAERFEMARNFMRNTVHTFLGGMGSGFVSQVEKCTSFEELRRHFKSWQEAMLLSSDGRKQLIDLQNRLAALLS